jgi:hypothetical protein
MMFNVPIPGGTMGYAVRTDCTFTGNFHRAKIMKRFSYEDGVTLETISLNQRV